MSVTDAVFDSFGLLEQILSFACVPELLAAAFVNKRWKEAARLDSLWRQVCHSLWKDKWGMSHVTGDDDRELPLFWRSLVADETIALLTEAQIYAFYSHPLLVNKKEDLEQCLDTSMMQSCFRSRVLCNVFSSIDHGHAAWFRDLWFASYASSVYDSKRTSLTTLELCSPRGYDMHFKITAREMMDEDFRDSLIPYDDDEGTLLYHHSICYFLESHGFSMELKDHSMHHLTDLTWTRTGEHTENVRVGQYPELTVRRQQDWGWNLENAHVVLIARKP